MLHVILKNEVKKNKPTNGLSVNFGDRCVADKDGSLMLSCRTVMRHRVYILGDRTWTGLGQEGALFVHRGGIVPPSINHTSTTFPRAGSHGLIFIRFIEVSIVYTCTIRYHSDSYKTVEKLNIASFLGGIVIGLS